MAKVHFNFLHITSKRNFKKNYLWNLRLLNDGVVLKYFIHEVFLMIKRARKNAKLWTWATSRRTIDWIFWKVEFRWHLCHQSCLETTPIAILILTRIAYTKYNNYLPWKIATWEIVAAIVAKLKPYVNAKKMLRFTVSFVPTDLG